LKDSFLKASCTALRYLMMIGLQMLEIHTKGGMLLSRGSEDDAKRVTEVVTWHARERKHPLICRAVSAERGTAGATR